jgi:magnesium chelatase family protein
MSVARIASRGQLGLDAPLVQVEVNLASGLPTFSMVGLPAKAVKESKERVRAAILNSNFEFPAGRITVNLAPADLPKEGGRFDLPIALGILLASGQIRIPDASPEVGAVLHAHEFYGELGLSGELKPVNGLVLAAARAAEAGHEIIVPRANVDETRVAARGAVRGADHLLEVCGHVQREAPLPRCDGPLPRIAVEEPDLRDVRGQAQAKRALTIAAAGGHSLLMVGPPGTGKSMLARRLPGLLPPLTPAEALEVAAIASVSASGFDVRTLGRRPFRAPHHTASANAIIGGGSHARPGEVSLAHRGVLFLDELPEFERRVLEALREPLETGVVAVSRAAMQAEYPAAFQLIAAMNPCPCGFFGDPVGDCDCTPPEIRKYRSRISGPLLDRIDMHIEVARVSASELLGEATGESSATVAAAVFAARDRQLRRAGKLNSALSAAELRKLAPIDDAALNLLNDTMVKLRLSARSYHRVVRVALTIADLAGRDRIETAHIAEAIQLRRAMAPIQF